MQLLNLMAAQDRVPCVSYFYGRLFIIGDVTSLTESPSQRYNLTVM